MPYLLIFESFEGQTRKIARRIARQLEDAGHAVHVFDAHDKTAPLSFDGIDKVILAAPVHERRHPKNFEILIESNREALKRLPTLMLSVSLKAAFEDGMEEAQDFLIEMKMRTGFEPDHEALVAGAVRPEAYDYYQQQIVQHVLLTGQDVDLSAGGHEFTDWTALNDAIADFIAWQSVENA